VAAVGEDFLCDDLLPPGWYRLMAGDQQQPGRLAPTCPGAGVCGTAAPVWLEAPPPANGSQVANLAKFL